MTQRGGDNLVKQNFIHIYSRRLYSSMAEQLICNQQVAGSSPVESSRLII